MSRERINQNTTIEADDQQWLEIIESDWPMQDFIGLLAEARDFTTGEVQNALNVLEFQTHLQGNDALQAEQALHSLFEYVKKDNPYAGAAEVADLLSKHLRFVGKMDRQLREFRSGLALDPNTLIPPTTSSRSSLRVNGASHELRQPIKNKASKASMGATGKQHYTRFAREHSFYERRLAQIGSWVNEYEDWLAEVRQKNDITTPDAYTRFAKEHGLSERFLAGLGSKVNGLSDRRENGNRRVKRTMAVIAASTLIASAVIFPSAALATEDEERDGRDGLEPENKDKLEIIVDDRGGRHLRENIASRSDRNRGHERDDDTLAVIVRDGSSNSPEVESGDDDESNEPNGEENRTQDDDISGNDLSETIEITVEEQVSSEDEASGTTTIEVNPTVTPAPPADVSDNTDTGAIGTVVVETTVPASGPENTSAERVYIERKVEQSYGGVSYTFQPGDSVWAVLRDVWGQEPTWDQIAAVLGSNGVDVSEVYGQAGQYDIAIGDTIFIPTYVEALSVPTPIEEVAAKYDTTVDVIRTLNPDLVSDGDLLAAGQEVKTTPMSVTDKWAAAGEAVDVLEVSATDPNSGEDEIVAESPTELGAAVQDTADGEPLTATETDTPVDPTIPEVQPDTPGTEISTTALDPAAELQRLLSHPNFEALDGHDRLQDGTPESEQLVQLLNEAAKHDVVVMTEAFFDLGDGRLGYEFVNNAQLAEFLHSLTADNPYQVVEVDTASDPSKIRIVIDSSLEQAPEVEIPPAEVITPVEEIPPAQTEAPAPDTTTVEPETVTGAPANNVVVDPGTPAPEFSVPGEAPQSQQPDVIQGSPPEQISAPAVEVEIGEPLAVEAPPVTPEIPSNAPQPGDATPLTRRIPLNLGQPNAEGNFQIPESLDGRWKFSHGTPGEQRWGAYAIVELVDTVSYEWHPLYPNDILVIGDANAEEGHVSHVHGVDLDLTVETRDAANVNGNPVKSLQLAQIIARTGTVKQIFYNDAWVIDEFNAWAQANGIVTRMQWVENHHHHFHIRLLDEYRGVYSGGGPEVAEPSESMVRAGELRQAASLLTENVGSVSAGEVQVFIEEFIVASQERGMVPTVQGMAAYLAHISSESDFRADAVGDNGHSHGIFQAQGGRREGLPADRPSQIRFSFDDMVRDGAAMGHNLIGMMQDPNITLDQIVEEGFDWLRPQAHLDNDWDKKQHRFDLAERIFVDLTS